MLKKLRLEFIALNMATVAVVLAVVFTAICVIDHRQNENAVFDALHSALDKTAWLRNDPMPDDGPDRIGAPGAGPAGDLDGLGENPGERMAPADSDGSNNLDDATGDISETGSISGDTSGIGDDATAAPAESPDGNGASLPPEIGGRQDKRTVTPVAVFALNDDGTLTSISETATASIASDVLEQAAESLRDAPADEGTLADVGLLYARRTTAHGTLVAFADTGSVQDWRGLAVTLACVGAATLLVFFLISVIFSRWTLRPVEDAWQKQRRFVADASHDLKTPLTVILANTSILLEHPEKSIASQGQWVESTRHEAESMQHLVNDLLLLAHLDEETAGDGGKRPRERVDLTDLVEGELLQFESVAFERTVTSTADLEPGAFCLGEPARLRRLVGTLLDNAYKYAGRNGEVDVSLRVRNGICTLAVRNTGAGIPAEDLPHVFDRFYRADKARTHDDTGYGLGLAIAHAIAEEHGGTLAATSDDETGTTFTVELPQV